MKKELLSSLLLSLVCLVSFCIVYPAIVWGIAQAAEGKGEGVRIKAGDGKMYYENIAQNFTDDKYFWSRPSAVNYNPAGSGGSNKGPNNPDYLATVQERIDSFIAHNRGIKKSDIPSDLVTASGSGLDPHISVQGAIVQVMRISKARNIAGARIIALITEHTEKPLFGMFGPEKINVLKLNIALDQLATK